jgi:hypothetical protein
MKKLLLIIALLFTNPVFTKDKIKSIGALDCGKFLSACNISLMNINCLLQTNWAQGYISGFNEAEIAGKRQVGREDVSSDSIKHALIKYCKDYPLEGVRDATIDIYIKIIEGK